MRHKQISQDKSYLNTQKNNLRQFTHILLPVLRYLKKKDELKHFVNSLKYLS